MDTFDVPQAGPNRSTGNEQSQVEEVQLTELLPVRQSRIRENGILENEAAVAEAIQSDALKVLRSFSSIDDRDVVERDLDLRSLGYGKLEQERPEDEEESWRMDRSRNGLLDPVEAEREKEKRIARSIEADSAKRRRKKRADTEGREARRGKPTRNKRKIAIGIAADGVERGSKNRRISKGEKNLFDNAHGNSAADSCDRMEEASGYLDLDEAVHSSGEIYVHDREAIAEQGRESDEKGQPVESSAKRSNGQSDRFESHRTAGVVVIVESTLTSSSSSSRYENESGGDEDAARTGSKLGFGAGAGVGAGVGAGAEAGAEAGAGAGAGAEAGQEKKYCCVVCEARFKGSGGLRNHYKIVHGAGPIFKCDECGKEFPLKERLKLHVRTHTGFKPYKCPECEKSFARGGQLVQHRRTHSQIKPYRCGMCSGTFTCAANLALHVKRHNGQKDHKCEICGRAFVRRDALKKHLECLHRDVKSFLCVICNKTFKGHLPQHMRTHARDRPHGCATCGQRFAQKSQLTVHQRTHSGQRPFRCLVCWQAFAHSTALKLHTRRHTGERPFKCAECNAGFTQLPHWKKHMKCIHGRNEPYACKKCPSFFRIKNDLECHEKTCHPELASELDVSNDSSSMPSATAPPIAPSRIPMMAVATTAIAANSATTATTSTSATIATIATACATSATTETSATPTTTPGTTDPRTAMVSALSGDASILDKATGPTSKYRVMSVERMRLLLAVLLKRISKQERLDELGFGKRLIDEVLYDSLISAGKDPAPSNGLSELETLAKNLEIFLRWTVPKEHWENFRRLNKTPEDILETLTAT